MKKYLGIILLFPAIWTLVAPQANLGLQELRWLSKHVFPGEALVGVALFGLSYHLLAAASSEKRVL